MTREFNNISHVPDYVLTINNTHLDGLGVRIKAGNPIRTEDSKAVFSVADMDNDNKFIVKSTGEVVVYHNLNVNKILLYTNTDGDAEIKTINNTRLNIGSTIGSKVTINGELHVSLNSLKEAVANSPSYETFQTRIALL